MLPIRGAADVIDEFYGSGLTDDEQADIAQQSIVALTEFLVCLVEKEDE